MFDPSAKPWLTAKNPEVAKQLYFDDIFNTKSYSTNGSIDLNPLDLAYRANEKQEYYQDFAYAVFELGAAYLTGGPGRVLRAAEGLFEELILNE